MLSRNCLDPLSLYRRAQKASLNPKRAAFSSPGSRLNLPENFPRKHCAMSARVIITIALRVRALRTECSRISGAASARRLLMPARETEAIILKTFPLGEADRLVSFLGLSSGRGSGLAAGCPGLEKRSLCHRPAAVL